MSTIFLRTTLTLAAMACVGTAHAWPQATLSFSDPSGVVGPNDSVDVWLDLAVAAAGPDLFFDPNAGAPFGLDPADLPTATWFQDSSGTWQSATITAIDGASLGMWFGCSGTFTAACTSGPPYEFTWQNGFNQLFAGDGTLTIAAGSSAHFLYGTFTPSAGPVAPGSYTFYRAPLGLDIWGTGVDAAGDPVLNPDGSPMQFSNYSFPYQTCNDNEAACAFTRVVAVPEPETYALMLVGLGLVGFAVRRR